jgi:hypothetical protein
MTDPETPPIRITYDGKLVLTTSQAAQRYGLELAAMRKALSRLGVEPMPEPLDGRTPLYLASALDKVMRGRPGRGSNLRGHG